jgi:hypothetical protein
VLTSGRGDNRLRKSSKPAILSVPHLALVADAERFRLRAIGEHVPQLRQFHVAVLFYEAGDVVAAAPTAGLALDRQGRDAEIREVWAWSLIASGRPKPHARRLAGAGGLTSGRGQWNYADP